MNLKDPNLKTEEEENLLYEVLTSSRSNEKAYGVFMRAAMHSDTFGNNVQEWAKIAEGICKNHHEQTKQDEVMKDKFILTLAAELADLFAHHLKETHKIN